MNAVNLDQTTREDLSFVDIWIIDPLNFNQKSAMDKILKGEIPDVFGDVMPNSFQIFRLPDNETIQRNYFYGQTFVDWLVAPEYKEDEHMLIYDFAYSAKMDIDKISKITDYDDRSNVIRSDFEKIVQERFNTDITLDQIESSYRQSFKNAQEALEKLGIQNTKLIEFKPLVSEHLTTDEITAHPYLQRTLDHQLYNIGSQLDSIKLYVPILAMAYNKNIIVKDLDVTIFSAHNGGDFCLPDGVNLACSRLPEPLQIFQVNGESEIGYKILHDLDTLLPMTADCHLKSLYLQPERLFVKDIGQKMDDLHERFGAVQKLKNWTDDDLLHELYTLSPQRMTCVIDYANYRITENDPSDYKEILHDIRYGNSWLENNKIILAIEFDNAPKRVNEHKTNTPYYKAWEYVEKGSHNAFNHIGHRRLPVLITEKPLWIQDHDNFIKTFTEHNENDTGFISTYSDIIMNELLDNTNVLNNQNYAYLDL